MKDKNGTLRVQGFGEVQVAPDEAVVHLQVITEAETASEAVEANARATRAVIEAVSAQPNHGVTTTGLGLSPILSGMTDDEPATIVGFRASNGVDIKTKVGYAGKIFDVGIEAGANQSSGISFRLQNESPYRDEALGLATRAAFKQASVVARAANVELLGPETIEVDPVPVFLYRTAALAERSAPTPVLPEDIRVSASVMITFRIRG